MVNIKDQLENVLLYKVITKHCLSQDLLVSLDYALYFPLMISIKRNFSTLLKQKMQ